MTPQEEHVAFYYELGRAFDNWSGVEHELSNVAYRCYPGTNPLVHLQGFYAIENFRSKLQHTDAVVMTKYKSNTTTLERWARLVGHISQCATKRNKLAHGSVIEFTALGARPGRRIALVEWAKWFKEGLTLKPPPGSICVRDISNIRVEFVTLMHALRDFAVVLGGASLPPSESRAPLPGRQTIPQITAHLHEALGHPPPPSRASRKAPGDDAAERERQMMREEGA